MSLLERLALCAVFAPFIGFVLALLGRDLKKFSEAVSMLGMVVAVIATLLLILRTKGDVSMNLLLFHWIHVDTLSLSWGIRIDSLVLVMLGVVNCISLLVHIYSTSYMAHDLSLPRFMAYLSFFTFMMLMLVVSPNMVQLFFGWEGVGLASYLLIGFWVERPKAGIAAIKAFVVNRVGDVGLILAMGGLFVLCGSLDFDVIAKVFATTPLPSLIVFNHAINPYDLIGFFLILGAMGKSAQFGLHVWLPDAMEGPTPVSALIHAATMVTAGIFLVARFSFLFELAVIAKEALVWIGMLTAFFAATVAITQTDIKRIIAYSTCSQLGYMLAACGCGAYNAAIFHLTTHAFFKALLFLGAGSVIHAMSDEQDLRKMGGIARSIPATYVFMWIGSLALAGIPFFAGFYSKDAILASLYVTHHPFAYIIGIAVVVMTSFYSWRLLWLAFHGKPRADEYVMAHVHESSYVMLVPLGVLGVGALFSGFIGQKLFIEQLGFGWKNALVTTNVFAEHLPVMIHYLPLVCAIIGIAAAIYIYGLKPHWSDRLSRQPFYTLSLHKWWIDECYVTVINKSLLAFSRFLWRHVDQRFIDRFGPDGVSYLCLGMSRANRYLQTGYVYHYALIIMIGVIALSATLFLSLR